MQTIWRLALSGKQADSATNIFLKFLLENLNFFQNYIFVTVEGERVLGGIRTGLVLAGGGTFLLNLPPLLIIPILQALSSQQAAEA